MQYFISKKKSLCVLHNTKVRFYRVISSVRKSGSFQYEKAHEIAIRLLINDTIFVFTFSFYITINHNAMLIHTKNIFFR